MRKPTLLLSFLLLAAPLRPASATTALPIQDGQLADQAVVIVEGTVTAVGPASGAGRPATEYHLRVERRIKGDAPESTLVVRVPGGTAANGLKLKVWGAPELRIGERALLFLAANRDGSYGPLHLSMGAFHELRSGTERLAVRNLSEIEGAGEETVRDLGRFGDWLRDRAAGVERPADYFADAADAADAGKARRAVEAFTYLDGTRQRWLEFDRGEDVPWQAEAAGQPGLAGGAFADFQAALQVWNADPSTNIRYTYQGTTTVTTGFQDFDGVNAILFTDPNDEAPGSFRCTRPGSGSGVLAIGGTWFDDSETPAVIRGADIVVNDGAGCWLTTGKRAEQVYGHELGHTLGLGHSCGDTRGGPCNTAAKSEALMRATAHADDRGARLGNDDRAAILDLYPNEAANAVPAAPANLAADAITFTQIGLTWEDRSNNETGFLIEMGSSTSDFKQVATAPANATSATIGDLPLNTPFTFRIRARNADGVSPYSNFASATTTGNGGPCFANSETLCLLGGRIRVRVKWKNGASNGVGTVVPLEGSSQTGMFWFFGPENIELIVKVLDGTSINDFFWTFYGGLSNVEYWIVVTDTQTGQIATYYNPKGNFCGDADVNSLPGSRSAETLEILEAAEPALTPATDAACAPGTLCLLDGRFQVEVAWQANGQQGTGTAVPLTDQSGLFWFFGPENIELVVKTLDGRPVNGKFWFFYGALSDVAYQIKVTDTTTGVQKTYANPAGNICGRADTSAF